MNSITETNTAFQDSFPPIKRAKIALPSFQAYERICLENGNSSEITPEELVKMETKVHELAIGKFTIYLPTTTSTQSFILCHPNERSFQIGLIDKKLGNGSYGEIYRATFLETDSNTQIAIKFSIDEKKDALESIKAEIKILKDLHENSESLIGIQPLPLTTTSAETFFSKREVIGYTMDLFECDYSDFMQRIRRSAPSPLTEHFVREMATQGEASLSNIFTHFIKLASAVDFLHEKGIFHSDIKSNNVLIKNGDVKLWDFGSAKNTTLGQNPTPEACPHGNSPFNDLCELSLKNYENPVERQEAIELAFHIDKYQLGDMFYRIFYWVSSGYLSNLGPYELENFTNTTPPRRYPKHFLPSFYAKEKTEATARKFPAVAKFSTKSETLIKQMVAVNKTQRPSIKKVIKTFKEVLDSFSK